jgi:hypothetical protein
MIYLYHSLATHTESGSLAARTHKICCSKCKVHYTPTPTSFPPHRFRLAWFGFRLPCPMLGMPWLDCLPLPDMPTVMISGSHCGVSGARCDDKHVPRGYVSRMSSLFPVFEHRTTTLPLLSPTPRVMPSHAETRRSHPVLLTGTTRSPGLS